MYVVQVPRRFTASDWGGTETAVLESSRRLVAAGHRVGIFTSMALARDSRETLEGIEVRRFRHLYPFLGLSAADVDAMDRKGGNLVSAGLMRALLQEPGISVLHAHSGKRLGGMVRTVARLRRLPYVVSLHGGWFELPAQSRQELARPQRGHLEWGKALGWMLGSRRVLEDAAAVICVGHDEYVRASAALPGARVELLPNGVDVDRFARGDAARFRHAFAIPAGRRIILNVGRIDPQKNQLCLLEATAMLDRLRHDPHLVMIGPVTDTEYLHRLQQAIAQAGLVDRVTLIQGLGPQDPLLGDAYHAASVFCLPSLHEPFGIVALEAWAAGLPVVAARVGGLARLTEDGVDALQVDPSEPSGIATAVSSLLSDPVLAARLSRTGHDKASREYDWRVVGRRLQQLYADVARH
jgi:glycosyltransferase involved in cell wall biosynthesis